MYRYLGFKPTNKPFYHFLSYNREDADRVGEIAKLLPEAGINVWYDGGIEPGEKWETIIAERIAHCQVVILFFTKGILTKPESFAVKEYWWAKEYRARKIIVVLMDQVESYGIPDHKGFWWIDIKKHQNIIAYDKTPEEVTAELTDSLIRMASSPLCDVPINIKDETDEAAKTSSCSTHRDNTETILTKKAKLLSKIKGKALLYMVMYIASMLLVINILKAQLGHSTIIQITTGTLPERQSIIEDDSNSSTESSSGVNEDDSGSKNSAEAESPSDVAHNNNGETSPDDTPAKDSDQEQHHDDAQGGNDKNDSLGSNNRDQPRDDSDSHGDNTQISSGTVSENSNNTAVADQETLNRRHASNDQGKKQEPKTYDYESEETTAPEILSGNPEVSEDPNDNIENAPSVDNPAEQEDLTSNEELIGSTAQPADSESSSDSTNSYSSDCESTENSDTEENLSTSADDTIDGDSNDPDFPPTDEEMEDYIGVNGADVKKLFTEVGLAVEFRTNDDQPIQPDCNLDDAIICGQSVSAGQTIPTEDLPVIFWVTFPSDDDLTENM